MKTAQHLFADLTALLEDMHAVAVEGQASSLSPDERTSLLSILRAIMDRMERKIGEAAAAALIQ